jgi:hypothetical protein
MAVAVSTDIVAGRRRRWRPATLIPPPLCAKGAPRERRKTSPGQTTSSSTLSVRLKCAQSHDKKVLPLGGRTGHRRQDARKISDIGNQQVIFIRSGSCASSHHLSVPDAGPDRADDDVVSRRGLLLVQTISAEE